MIEYWRGQVVRHRPPPLPPVSVFACVRAVVLLQRQGRVHMASVDGVEPLSSAEMLKTSSETSQETPATEAKQGNGKKGESMSPPAKSKPPDDGGTNSRSKKQAVSKGQIKEEQVIEEIQREAFEANLKLKKRMRWLNVLFNREVLLRSACGVFGLALFMCAAVFSKDIGIYDTQVPGICRDVSDMKPLCQGVYINEMQENVSHANSRNVDTVCAPKVYFTKVRVGGDRYQRRYFCLLPVREKTHMGTVARGFRFLGYNTPGWYEEAEKKGCYGKTTKFNCTRPIDFCYSYLKSKDYACTFYPAGFDTRGFHEEMGPNGIHNRMRYHFKLEQFPFPSGLLISVMVLGLTVFILGVALVIMMRSRKRYAERPMKST